MNKVAGLVRLLDFGFPPPFRQHGLDRVHLLGWGAAERFVAIGRSRARSAGTSTLSNPRNASIRGFTRVGRYLPRD